jgi:hypothetical protein
MIPGVVNGNLEATVRLVVRGSGGQEQEIEAVIDTGFNGFLTLSPALGRQLGLPHIGQSRVLLANGSRCSPICKPTIAPSGSAARLSNPWSNWKAGLKVAIPEWRCSCWTWRSRTPVRR